MVHGTAALSKWVLNQYGIPIRGLAKCPGCGCQIIRVVSDGRLSYYDYVMCTCHSNYMNCPQVTSDPDYDDVMCGCKTCDKLIRQYQKSLGLPIEIMKETGKPGVFNKGRVTAFMSRR